MRRRCSRGRDSDRDSVHGQYDRARRAGTAPAPRDEPGSALLPGNAAIVAASWGSPCGSFAPAPSMLSPKEGKEGATRYQSPRTAPGSSRNAAHPSIPPFPHPARSGTSWKSLKTRRARVRFPRARTRFKHRRGRRCHSAPIPGIPRAPRGQPSAPPVPPGPYLGAAGTAAEPLPGPALRIAGRSRQMGRREGVKISSEIRAAFLADQSPGRRGGSSAVQGDNATAERMGINPRGGGGTLCLPLVPLAVPTRLCSGGAVCPGCLGDSGDVSPSPLPHGPRSRGFQTPRQGGRARGWGARVVPNATRLQSHPPGTRALRRGSGQCRLPGGCSGERSASVSPGASSP